MDILDVRSSLLNILESWDKWLFLKINNNTANPVFDFIMPYLRESVYWAPLYLFLLVFILMNFGSKGVWWCVGFLCVVAMTDMVSSRLVKEIVQRTRPCNNPDLIAYIHLLIKRCSGSYSFTSSHAANHFGMATFFFLTFRPLYKKWTWIVFLWAAFIGYAQVYVGVHYPLDIFGGAGLGFLFGSFIALVFNKKFGFINFDKQQTVP